MILLGLAAIAALGVGVTALQVWWLRSHNPNSTSWMRMRREQSAEAGKPLSIRQTFVPLTSLPRTVPAAVIAAEDDGFYSHHGFDWDAIKKAWKHNEAKGAIKRGGSTITQQLAKNLYLRPTRSYIRKGREGVITWFLEQFLSKQRILELYLNYIEFGPGVFGIEEAARYHFHTSALKLSTEQASLLAAIIPSPLRYKTNGVYVQNRASRIRRALAIE